MRKFLLSFLGIIISCTIFASCSEEEDFFINEFIQTDTIIKKDTTITQDTIILKNDSTGKNDTIIMTDTIIKSDTIIHTDTITNKSNYINTNNDSIIVVHWNIGHFSNGTSSNTNITEKDYASKKMAYISLLKNLNADILGICEYNREFSKEGIIARDSIFYMFDYAYIGPKYQYNCNAILTKGIPIYNEKYVSFSHYVQHRYYTCVDLYINNHCIKFVETHLDWNQNENGATFRESQIKEIINHFQKDKYVILCGDFNNSYGIEEYDPFIQAGYEMANGGKYGSYFTYRAKNPTDILDNIFVKGLDIKMVESICDPNLSDHCIIKCTVKTK